jgi:hypothetical protein
MLLLLGVGEERRVRTLVVAPDAVSRLKASKPGVRLVQQHKQSTKFDLVAGRAVRHLGHGVRVDREPCHAPADGTSATQAVVVSGKGVMRWPSLGSISPRPGPAVPCTEASQAAGFFEDCKRPVDLAGLLVAETVAEDPDRPATTRK